MRLIVCGGRDYSNEKYLNFVLDKIHEYGNIECLATGGAIGADTLAINWAVINNIPYCQYKADWVQYGKHAGPIRNQHMLDDFNPTHVLAFPGGKGTNHMITISRKAGVKTLSL